MLVLVVHDRWNFLELSNCNADQVNYLHFMSLTMPNIVNAFSNLFILKFQHHSAYAPLLISCAIFSCRTVSIAWKDSIRPTMFGTVHTS